MDAFMQLLFLGTGGAFTYGEGNYQSNMLLLADNGEKLLIDCGTDIRFSLGAFGWGAKDISAVYISHLHADHIGGLEWLGFSTYFQPQWPKPKLFIEQALAPLLWEKSLSGGMDSLEDRIAVLDDYFAVQRIGQEREFFWNGAHLQLIAVPHYTANLMPALCFGLFITYQEKSYLLTTDTRFVPDVLGDFYEKSALIFHDCETSPYPSGVHAHFNQLKNLPAAVKQKTWLYHYNSGARPNATAAGFRGYVAPGQIFFLGGAI
jgi:ribonuclease BN (tRNA processing enzyme)